MGWMSWLFPRRAALAPASPARDEADGPDAPPDEPPPAWAQELIEALLRSARAQAKLGLRVEEIERKVEGGFADLRGQVQLAAAPKREERERRDELFDAMDLLDEAIRAADDGGQGALGDGLRGVQARLDRFLAQSQLRRLALLGEPPDGRRQRVVGTAAEPQLSEGAVVRVVRATIVRGDELVREGEVLVNRREAS